MYLAAEEGGTSNFLIPNATFFVCLAIFVIVFLVIRTMVVPPIVRVMQERDDRVAKTVEDNKSAAASYEEADSGYRAAVTEGRADATGIRDQARAEGNEQLAEAKNRATREADQQLAAVSEQLKVEGDTAADTARRDVDALSATLAARVLGNEATSSTTAQTSGAGR
ncbi:F0F1 ATP synthase subunit B [Gordonia sp. PKS22-38]|uniref:ATP synthase subunit b n=1 Tax=Gordonia prachuapensis TaxID=3115651 RepID=A0ABU7MRV6_9ACTN|nr:F0F1 ATP synthase subunit B [Gordonia sp. PKS22-38]